MNRSRRIALFCCMFLFVLAASSATAQQVYEHNFASIPKVEPVITDWISEPVTPLAHRVRSYTKYALALVLPFLFLPQLLLVYSIIRFRKRPGRKPATFHENIKLEVVWTVIPALVLVGLAIPSYALIRDIETMPEPDMSIEIIGQQFQWRYKYLDHGIETAGEPLIVPVNNTVVANLTSVDVNHAWWVPAFGVKIDTIPGRLTQLWFDVEKTGWYKGQCAELCGSLHSKMMIDVWVVTQEEFDGWIAEKKAELEAPPPPAPAGS